MRQELLSYMSQHHDEIRDGQVDDEHVGGRPHFFPLQVYTAVGYNNIELF